jgi:hypothetical protein
MKKPKVLLFGDSHTDALKKALRKRTNVICDFEAYRYARPKNDGQIGDFSEEEILAKVAALSPQDIVISTIGGNQHQVVSLIQHPISFDIMLKGDAPEPVAENDYVIPYAQIREYFENGLRGKDGRRLQALKNSGTCRVFHLVPPPPKEDEAHILKKQETAFVEAGLKEKGISPAALRLKIWRLQVQVLQQLTAEWDVGLLTNPDGTRCSKGFLHPDYYAQDATHANAAYGELVFKQIEKLLEA